MRVTPGLYESLVLANWYPTKGNPNPNPDPNCNPNQVRAHTGPTNAMLTVQCALRAAPGNWIRVGSEAALVGLGLG